MLGALEQLLFKGSEDIHLTVDPDISYFKSVYLRHSHFSMESIPYTVGKTLNFSSETLIKINPVGELIYKMYLEVILPFQINSTATWTNRVGFNLIKQIDFFVGDILVERIFGLWLHIWSEISNSYDKNLILNDIVGTTSSPGTKSNGLQTNKNHKLIIPLNFFFCSHISKVFPIRSLNNQDITFLFKFENKKTCLQNGNIVGNINNLTLWIDNIFLENNEARKFIQNDYDCLFDTAKKYENNIFSIGKQNIEIPMRSPCKEIVWVFKKNNLSVNTDKFTDFTYGLKSKNEIAKFYKSRNFNGWETELKSGNYTNSDLLKLNSNFNELSSIITNGFKIILYINDNFTGSKLIINKDATNIGDFTNKVRSLKVIKKEITPELYSDLNFSINLKPIFSSGNLNYKYFNFYIPYKYHTGCPSTGINMYSFSLFPEDGEPSGSLCLLKDEKLNLTFKTKFSKGKIIIFTRNYNLYKIINNKFSLLYN